MHGFSWETHLVVTKRHLPYEITRYYLLHSTQVNVPCFNLSHTNRYSIYPE